MTNPFAHIELNTDDVAKAKKFYGKVFAWKFQSVSDHYSMIDTGKGPQAGVQKKPMPEAPTMWLPYVQVESVKRSVAKAKKAGADVKVDFMPIGEFGAIGVFVDPTGAAIGVWEMAKKPAKKAAKKAAKKPAKKPAKKASRR